MTFSPSQFEILHLQVASLQKSLEDLRDKYEILHGAITEISMWGTSRPRELGEGDDGDGHYKRICHEMIRAAAIARRSVR